MTKLHIDFSDCTRHTELAERFLAVEMPGLPGKTWSDGIRAALDQGWVMNPAELPFVQFLNSDVPLVSGWTWGDAIQESEQHQPVSLALLPLGQFIEKQESATEMDFIDEMFQRLPVLTRRFLNRHDGGYRPIPVLLRSQHTDWFSPYYQGGVLHFPPLSEANRRALEMEIVTRELLPPFSYNQAQFAGDFNWGGDEPLVSHELGHQVAELPARRFELSSAVDEGGAVDRSDSRLGLMGVELMGGSEEAAQQLKTAMQPQSWCLTCRQAHAAGKHK